MIVWWAVPLSTGFLQQFSPRNSDDFLLVEINEIRECGVAIGVNPQKAVEVPRGIHKEVLEASLQTVGQGVAPDFLTDPDQECSLSHVLQKILCIFSANNSMALGSSLHLDRTENIQKMAWKRMDNSHH